MLATGLGIVIAPKLCRSTHWDFKLLHPTLPTLSNATQPSPLREWGPRHTTVLVHSVLSAAHRNHASSGHAIMWPLMYYYHHKVPDAYIRCCTHGAVLTVLSNHTPPPCVWSPPPLCSRTLRPQLRHVPFPLRQRLPAPQAGVRVAGGWVGRYSLLHSASPPSAANGAQRYSCMDSLKYRVVVCRPVGSPAKVPFRACLVVLAPGSTANPQGWEV